MRSNTIKILHSSIEKFFWPSLSILLFMLYMRLIRLDPILNFDDENLVSPIRSISHLSDYFLAIRNHQIWDVQPIRDLSYWLDWRLKDILLFHSFHLTNLAIWIGILYLLYRTLSALQFSSGIRFFAIAIYASHPVFNNSVSSIAARKHLLATFFILGATLGVIRIARSPTIGAKAIITILLSYTASIFSHPINLLWPAFAMIYLVGHQAYRRNPRSTALLLACLATLSVMAGAANFAYYTGAYSLQSSIPKFSGQEANAIGIKLLAIGRYFFQAIFPAWPCQTQCYPGSLKNMTGLAILPLLLLTLFKTKNREASYWAIYFILPILLVTFRMTNIFVSDTYLLNAGIGLGISFIYILRNFLLQTEPSEELIPAHQRVSLRRVKHFFIYTAPALIILLFTIKSFEQVRHWENNFSFWKSSFRTEATPFNATFYARELLNQGDIRGAFDLAFRVSQWNSQIPGLGELYAKSLYLHPDLTREQKIQIFERIPSPTSLISTYLNKLYDNNLTPKQ